MGQGINNLADILLQEAGMSIPDENLDNEGFVRLYRAAIDRLCARAAAMDGKGAAAARDLAMLCRSLLSCPNLESAIHCAAEFSAMLHPRIGVLGLRVEGTHAVFLMDTQRRRPDRCSCLVDVTGLLGFVQLFGWLIGERLRLRLVALGYPHREDVMPFLGLFEVPVYMGAPVYRLEFDAQQLTRPVMRRPEELLDFTSTFPYNIVGPRVHALPLRFRVRAFMDAALARGKPMPELGALVVLIDGSESTLRRRLREEGTNYKALRDLCLREAAERYLAHGTWTVDQIVERLGFSDSLALRRAFRRWTGMTPTQYRKSVTG
ncbi:hypothetical protein B9N43_04975 [Denitratisoma sp. DHT3]|uniref:helix-turn-helix domain-containing protein n=1 Tax=Denitratisoma sp. DHT3 TaxID=1981880 RepID=UPI0011983048|nr:AraC family transcriptional regulator [Denitratisoma sp. DHT3]QDX80653.1 hypothetical protein B9N43_04975 [Denitratisoma sp. DHT3]